MLCIGDSSGMEMGFGSSMSPASNQKHLDVAGGTGDIAFRVLQAARETALPPVYRVRKTNDTYESSPQVIVCDINDNMLRVGIERAKSQYGSIQANSSFQQLRLLQPYQPLFQTHHLPLLPTLHHNSSSSLPLNCSFPRVHLLSSVVMRNHYPSIQFLRFLFDRIWIAECDGSQQSAP